MTNPDIDCDLNVDQSTVDLYSHYLSEKLTKDIKFKKKLKSSIKKLYQEIKYGHHDRSKTINLRVIKGVINNG